MRAPSVWILIVGMTAGGCVGIIGEPGLDIGGGGPDGGGGPPLGGPGTPPETCMDSSPAGPARLWRLSHAQYDNSIRDLLGSESPAAGFEPETGGTGFRNGADVSFVSETLAEQYMFAAEALAETAVADLSRLLPCDPPDANDRGCVESFVESFARRALRKPLSEEQRGRYIALYDEGAATSGEIGVSMIIEAMLQSPHFLYRFELGYTGTGVVQLTSHEMATQLSYVLWNTTPDEDLLARADEDALVEPSAIADEIDRMLGDPRARHLVWDFFVQYFGLEQVPYLEKDANLFPEFTPSLSASLNREAEAFISDVVWDGDGTLRTLLTADYTFVNEELADLYGVGGVRGDELIRVSLDSGERSGLLTQAGFLATLGDQDSGSPTFRGHFIRTQLLCQDIPDPPPDVADVLEPPDEVRTTRERYEAHLVNTSCVGCHSLMDPMGFGFESFDAIGRFRTTENGVAIDDSGSIEATDEIDGEFRGARELAGLLAGTSQVSDCIAMHFYRYLLGRLDQSGDSCEIARIREQFSASGTDVLTLLRAVVAGPAFGFRTSLTEERP